MPEKKKIDQQDRQVTGTCWPWRRKTRGCQGPDWGQKRQMPQINEGQQRLGCGDRIWVSGRFQGIFVRERGGWNQTAGERMW